MASIEHQVILITEATHALGIKLARKAAERGADLVLGSQDGKKLNRLLNDISKTGVRLIGKPLFNLEDLRHLKEEAMGKLGHIDTWINSGMASHQSYLLRSTIQEEREIFEFNYWQAREGSHLAVEAMGTRGGNLINFGSEIDTGSIPLRGTYMASKKALKVFTDSLRSELKTLKLPINVSLIRPKSSETDEELEYLAEVILSCAESPQREVIVGGPAKLSSLLENFFPVVKDIISETKMKEMAKKNLGLGTHQQRKQV